MNQTWILTIGPVSIKFPKAENNLFKDFTHAMTLLDEYWDQQYRGREVDMEKEAPVIFKAFKDEMR